MRFFFQTRKFILYYLRLTGYDGNKYIIILMVFSSNTYTFYCLLVSQSPWLGVRRLEDLRLLRYSPLRSSAISSQKVSSEAQLHENEYIRDLSALPVFKTEDKRKRRPSFIME